MDEQDYEGPTSHQDFDEPDIGARDDEV